MSAQPDLSNLFTPSPVSSYFQLTKGGDFKVSLSQEQSALVLKIHDYGVECLDEDEKQILYSIVGDLKNLIWP